ncbi:hypothetical protein L596_010009 [Steinernema carpocapsae]|uniref:Uncharacterized protein n=1 Tax=Steinernema carpocapsae TaxID=34508 RepID=A0A4U5PIB9_STECR|nr:hypothetical protein L596_010009 [Steinernema carpocapsae]
MAYELLIFTSWLNYDYFYDVADIHMDEDPLADFFIGFTYYQNISCISLSFFYVRDYCSHISLPQTWSSIPNIDAEIRILAVAIVTFYSRGYRKQKPKKQNCECDRLNATVQRYCTMVTGPERVADFKKAGNHLGDKLVVREIWKQHTIKVSSRAVESTLAYALS